MADYSHKEAEHTPDEARKHDLKKIKANLRKIDKARVYRGFSADERRAVRKAEDLLNGRKVEGAYIIDKGGNVVWKNLTGRSKDSVRIDMNAARDNIVVHNHPFEMGKVSKLTTRAGNGLSDTDIRNAIRGNQRAVIAKSSDGYTYTLNRPRGGWTAEQRAHALDIGRDWTRLWNKYHREIGKPYVREAKTRKEMAVRDARRNSAITARVNREIGKKYGLKIRRTMAASK